MMGRPKYVDWYNDYSDEYEDDWTYRTIDEYPAKDAPWKKILEFIEDAKEAEKAKEEDLIEEGKSPHEAKVLACQWPLKDDTPEEIVREFVGYNHDMQASPGVDL